MLRPDLRCLLALAIGVLAACSSTGAREQQKQSLVFTPPEQFLVDKWPDLAAGSGERFILGGRITAAKVERQDGERLCDALGGLP